MKNAQDHELPKGGTAARNPLDDVKCPHMTFGACIPCLKLHGAQKEQDKLKLKITRLENALKKCDEEFDLLWQATPDNLYAMCAGMRSMIEEALK